MTCAKNGYASRKEAKRYARRHHRYGPSLTAYRCDDCSRWHLTSKSAAYREAWRGYNARRSS